jgi:hypothetical protein
MTSQCVLSDPGRGDLLPCMYENSTVEQSMFVATIETKWPKTSGLLDFGAFAND